MKRRCIPEFPLIRYLIQLLYKSGRNFSVILKFLNEKGIFIYLICLVEGSGGLNMGISRHSVLFESINKFVGKI